MDKREFQRLLDQGDSSLMKCAADLGLAKSTVSRWRDHVPRYAVWYALARLVMDDQQRAKVDEDTNHQRS